jgi:hypothetical protein
MKKSAFVRLMPILLLVGAVMMSAGCSTELTSCESKQLPSKWAEMKLPLVEGTSSVCTWNGGKDAYLTYKGVEFFELHDKYAEKLKNDGWEFSLAKPDRTFFAARKDGKSFTFGFDDCRVPLTTCSRVHVSGP